MPQLDFKSNTLTQRYHSLTLVLLLRMIEGNFLSVTHHFIIQLHKMSPGNEVYGRKLIM